MGTSTGSCVNASPNLAVGAGEVKTINCIGGPAGTSGSTYDVSSLNITYTTPSGISKTFYGSKSLLGKYS